MMTKNGTPYQSDALKMSSDTSIEEVQDFLRRRIQNPYIINGKIIWNFSNHEPDMEALEFAANNKLEQDKYVVPYQVTGTWGFMVQLLPEEIQRSEILVYKQQYNDYAAYTNLASKLTTDEMDQWKEEVTSELDKLDISA